MSSICNLGQHINDKVNGPQHVLEGREVLCTADEMVMAGLVYSKVEEEYAGGSSVVCSGV